MNLKKSTVLIASALSVAVILSTIQSCVKDNFELDKLIKTAWNPDLAVPLVYSSLTIQDILTKHDTQGLIVVDPTDNFCTLVYKGNLFSKMASELISIPLQTIAPYTSPALTPAQISALSTTGTVTAVYSQTVNFSPLSSGPIPKVDSVTFKSGDIGIDLSSSFKFNGEITITIPSAKKNGVVFSQLIPFPYLGTIPVKSLTTFSLAGYTFDMTNGGTTYNQFVVNYSVKLTGTGTPPSSSDAITLNQSMSNLQFSKLFGDIGQQALLAPDKDTVEISIFKNALGIGIFSFVNPTVKVVMSNSYGIPIYANIVTLEGYTPPSTTYPITGSGVTAPLPIYYPSFSEIGQTKTGTIILDNSNSNIVSVINNISKPKFLIYKINSQTNPAGATHNNFVLDTSRFKVDIEINLPLHGTANDFVLIDTVAFDMGDANMDGAESVMLRTFNSNWFPIDIDMQIYFVDSLYTKLDSLITPGENPILSLAPAHINAAGVVTSPTEKIYDATLTKPRLDNLKTTKHMLVMAKASTANSGLTNVKIYSNYRLDVKLGMQIKLKQSF